MGVLHRRASDVFPCDPSLVYDILTDYDHYSEWMPRVAKSKLLAKEGDLAIAEIGLAKPRSEGLAVECIHSRNTAVIGRAIGGSIPVSRIEWTLNSSGGNSTNVALAIEIEFSGRWLLPAYWGLMDARHCVQALKGYLSAFVPDLALAGEKGEKILELTETSEGPVLWLRGKRYVMREAPEGKS